jgi:hypothetical protein
LSGTIRVRVIHDNADVIATREVSKSRRAVKANSPYYEASIDQIAQSPSTHVKAVATSAKISTGTLCSGLGANDWANFARSSGGASSISDRTPG